MRIIYSSHAENQMVERKIAAEWVNEVIKAPETMRKLGFKYVVSRKLNSHTLEVVYVKENYINVITCYFLQ